MKSNSKSKESNLIFSKISDPKPLKIQLEPKNNFMFKLMCYINNSSPEHTASKLLQLNIQSTVKPLLEAFIGKNPELKPILDQFEKRNNSFNKAMEKLSKWKETHYPLNKNTVESLQESKYNIRFVNFPSKSRRYNINGKMTTKVNIFWDCEIAETPENIKNEIINDFNEWCKNFGSNEVLKLDLEVSPND